MRAVLGVTVQSSKRLRKLSFEGKHQGTSGKGGGVCLCEFGKCEHMGSERKVYPLKECVQVR